MSEKVEVLLISVIPELSSYYFCTIHIFQYLIDLSCNIRHPVFWEGFVEEFEAVGFISLLQVRLACPTKGSKTQKQKGAFYGEQNLLNY